MTNVGCRLFENPPHTMEDGGPSERFALGTVQFSPSLQFRGVRRSFPLKFTPFGGIRTLMCTTPPVATIPPHSHLSPNLVLYELFMHSLPDPAGSCFPRSFLIPLFFLPTIPICAQHLDLSVRAEDPREDPPPWETPTDDPVVPQLPRWECVGVYLCRFRTKNSTARSNNLPNSFSASGA